MSEWASDSLRDSEVMWCFPDLVRRGAGRAGFWGIVCSFCLSLLLVSNTAGVAAAGEAGQWEHCSVFSYGPKGPLRSFSWGPSALGRPGSHTGVGYSLGFFDSKWWQVSLRGIVVAQDPQCVFVWTSETDWPEFKSQLNHPLAKWAWAHYTIFLNHNFCFHKNGQE